MAKVDGGVMVIKTLLAGGIDQGFALHGGHLEPVFQAAIDHSFPIIDTRHEAAAGHAGAGYAKSNGRPAAVFVTAGPGMTNVITALADAYLDGVPMIVIAGAEPLVENEANALQGGFDQVALAKPVSKWAFRITRTETIPRIVARAIRVASTGRPGPVFLEIPADVIYQPLPYEEFDSPKIELPAKPAPGVGSLGEALDLLKKAKRPIIMAGAGVALSQSQKLLTAFAEMTDTPVYTNCKAHGAIPTRHPLWGGDFANLKALNDEGAPPDVVLLLGARIGRYTGGMTDSLVPFDTKIISVDIDGSEIGRLRPVKIGIEADCSEFLNTAITDAAGYDWSDREEWRSVVTNAADWHIRRFKDALDKSNTPIHPYKAGFEIVNALPQQSWVVVDGGESYNWIELNLAQSDIGGFMVTGYLGCLGTGMPYAIGAQLAHPDKPIVCIAGDGAVGFNIQEFDTMARHNLPILNIVFNNQCWGLSKHGQMMMFGANRQSIVDLADSGYDGVAKAFGCHGERVTEADEIGPAIRRALDSGLPSCLNIVVDREVVAPFTEALVGNRKSQGEVVIPYYENLNASA
ncbi:thiamine pyrophosphate-binding protein [Hyphococcus flavus]|uniref:Thiamine pyrophosphate-binding protein n=1 Tax=Hyphococcus flavus TaxID=1866326 RepID=A0AAE9ZH59_9PROT|nr:thiamine pyrophosphate-binding protein [Hyphococcus flavus]WDI30105.1 thiamine pyrophosphate-binding protein [Hyphococcus flavus]